MLARWPAAALAALISILVVLPADAQRRRPKAPATIDVGAARAKLASPSPNAAAEGAKILAAAGPAQKAAAQEALIGALALGLSPASIELALGALVALGPPAPSGIVRAHARHRRSRVRVVALEALTVIDRQGSEADLLAALGDPDASVRAAAAKLLADHDRKSAIEPLLALLRRGEESAGLALGRLADAEVARRVAEMIGEVPDALVARTLSAMLLSPKFGPEPVRVEVVRALAKLPGSDAIEALSNYVASVPETPVRESRQEAETAIEKRLSEGQL